MRIRRYAAPLALLLGIAPPAHAQDVSFGGQVRPRFEYRDPVEGTAESFVSMRVRANVDAALDDGVSLFVQIQDVRFWGEARSTLGDFNANNLDLHQGYLQYAGGAEDWFTGRAGRQRTRFGGERLVGWVDWTQQGRTFDGLRLIGTKPWGRVDLVAYKLAESMADDHESDGDFVGLYSVLERVAGGNLDGYALYNHMGGDDRTSQGTLGLRHVVSSSRIRYRAEASYQFGERIGRDVSAFMLGARVGTSLASGRSWLTLWYDYLSGGEPGDEKLKVFSTLFATNHKFYGLADLFLNIPRHTGGRGLQDLALKGSYAPIPKLPIGLDIHSFWLAQPDGLESGGHLGEEIDLTVTYRHSQHLAVVGGFSYVFQDQAWAEIGRLEENMVWTYLMLNASF